MYAERGWLWVAICLSPLLCGCSQAPLLAVDYPQADEQPTGVVNPAVTAGPTALANSYVGVSGCAASGCHGATSTKNPPWQTAFHVWYRDDPHRRAFEVLYTQRSVRMYQLLESAGEKIADEKIDGNKYLQFLQQRCLGCHATPPAEPAPSSPTAYVNGVSCESCHGAAGDWTVAHLFAGWRDTGGAPSPLAKATGFVDTRLLVTRAERCVQCHVGPSQQCDMNHDLIAAGHPRLDFQFEAYLANLPAHWDRAQDEATRPGTFHFDAWQIGQYQTAIQQLKLLDWRLTSTKAVYPEFANFDCQACHRPLTGDTSRSLLTAVPATSTPHYVGRPQLEMLAAISDNGAAKAGQPAFNADLSVWLSPSKAVVEKIDPLIARLSTNLRSVAVKSPDKAECTSILRSAINGDDWTRAVQSFLALSAYEADLPPDAEKTALSVQLDKLFALLQSHFDHSAPTPYDAPRPFRADDVKKQLDEIERISFSPSAAGLPASKQP